MITFRYASKILQNTSVVWTQYVLKCYNYSHNLFNICHIRLFSLNITVLLQGHSGEIICLSFNSRGDQILTGSFDNTVCLWDVNTGQQTNTLIGHRGEIANAHFNFDCSMIATASMDRSCKVCLV